MVSDDPIILGHNQFIGINYLSQDRGRELKSAFEDIEKVLEILRFSKRHGVNALMFSNNELLDPLVKSLSADERDSLAFYPVVPYLRKYVKEASSKGLVQAALGLLSNVHTRKKIDLAVRGARQLVRRDILDALAALVDLELAPFDDTKIKVVFLHNQVTDLAMALDAKHVIEFYDAYVRDHRKLVPGYGTDNFAFLVKKFKEWGIRAPNVMAAFNKIGFLMNPSKEACESALHDFDGDLFAMSTLAGGRLAPTDAYDYVLKLPRLRSVIVGYSTIQHGLETLRAIESLLERADPRFAETIKLPPQKNLG